MGRRSDHSREELRSMALQAARNLVIENGVAGLTTRAVARQLGYTPGTLYLIFENFDDLVYALNAETVAEMRATIEKAAALRKTPTTRLHAIAEGYLSFALAQPNLWRLAIEHQPASDGPGRGAITTQTEQLLSMGVEAFRELLPRATGERLRLVTAAFWSGIHGVCHLSLTDNLKIATDRSARRLLQLQVQSFLDGLS